MKKLVMLVAAVMLGLGTLTSCGGRKAQLEESAKPIVTSVVSERYLSSLPENQTIIETLSPTPPVSCLRVKITEKVDDTHYKAIATLDNGNDIRIMIEDRGDKVQVSIPEQSGF